MTDTIDLVLSDGSDGVPAQVRAVTLDELAASGDVVRIPDRWLIHERQTHGGKAHGYITLKPGRFGERNLLAGDILAHEEDSPALERLVAHGDIAALPMDHGVLGLIFALRCRVERLEQQLAEATKA